MTRAPARDAAHHRPPARLDGLVEGAPVALVVGDFGVVIATGRAHTVLTGATEACASIAAIDADIQPRWVWWSARSAAGPLLATDARLRLGRCWDLAAVHRLIHGGSADDPAIVWAVAHGLDPGGTPPPDHLDLLSAARSLSDDNGDPTRPLRPDGYLRADWVEDAWAADPARAAQWAGLALQVMAAQSSLLEVPDADADSPGHPDDPGRLRGNRLHTAWSESAAELIACELATGGLPVDVPAAEEVVASFVGLRPSDSAHAARLRAERDARVFATVPDRSPVDLRSPARVKELLADAGVHVPDTRSWRLKQLHATNPLVEALLRWRQSERFATTYGYRWLDDHVGADGRLRGEWSGSDGGGGRMTAQAGLHSMPKELRVAVRAEPGRVLVRADLGQVEPRVLAAVSGDRALARAARDDDLYAPVAARLDVDRATAKVAVLAAMYGQTSGAAGEALAGMERSYPVAMAYLAAAHESGRRGRDVRTFGGRRVRVWPIDEVSPDADRAEFAAYRAALTSRARFTRNAVVQGAAAELFKAWVATIRGRLNATAGGVGRPVGPVGEIVLCLHDEVVLQVPADRGAEFAAGIATDLDSAARRWCPTESQVRFVADVSVIGSWADAKG